jgi:hypothetical protein
MKQENVKLIAPRDPACPAPPQSEVNDEISEKNPLLPI